MVAFRYVRISSSFLQELADLILQGESCVLLGPRHIGKRYVLSRLAEHLEKNGPSPVRIVRFVEDEPLGIGQGEAGAPSSGARNACPSATSHPQAAEGIIEELDHSLSTPDSTATLLAANVDARPYHMAQEFLAALQTRVQGRGPAPGRLAIPATATQAAYAEEIERSYPFHPELLDVLNRKVATVPNFQKTRGVLRLLGHTVRNVWKEKAPDAFLIHPYHVDLAVAEMQDELTGRLGKGEYLPVIQSDIHSEKKASPSHAQVIDKDWVDKGQPPLARRLAQTIFLHSLCEGAGCGAELGELNVAVGQPGLDYDFIDKTLQRIADTFWHLAPDTTRYRLQVEHNIVKVIDSEMGNIGTAEVKNELDLRVRQAYETKHFDAVFFPEEPSKVDDDAGQPKLVIPHYDSIKLKGAESPPPSLVRSIYERAGTQGKYRNFQNNLVFLAADAAELSQMIRVCRRYKALRRITDSPERMSDFGKPQQKKLRDELADAELGVRVAITRAYRHLFYPDAAAPAEHYGLKHYVLPVQEAADAKKHQQDTLLRVLRNLKKVMVADDEPDSPDYVKEKLWPSDAEQMTTEDFRKAFCKKRSLPIVLAADLIKRTIRNGVEQGTWVYFDGERAFHIKTALPSVQLTDDHTLYTPEKADELGLLVEACPKCGKHPCVCETKVCPNCGQSPCVCRELCPLCGKPPSQCTCGAPKRPLVGEGTPAKAFTQLADACTDGKVGALAALAIQADAVEDVRRLALAISQLPGTLPHVRQTFGGTQQGDRLDLSFDGGWKTFGAVQKFVEAISKQLPDRAMTSGGTSPNCGGSPMRRTCPSSRTCSTTTLLAAASWTRSSGSVQRQRSVSPRGMRWLRAQGGRERRSPLGRLRSSAWATARSFMPATRRSATSCSAAPASC